MIDVRIKKLANTLINYSVSLKKNEQVLISYEGDECKPLVKELIKEAYKKNATPIVEIGDTEIKKELIQGVNKKDLLITEKIALDKFKSVDAYIALRGSKNLFELSDLDPKKLSLYNQETRKSLDYRVNHLKWVVLRYPCNSLAQISNMSFKAYEDLFFKVCNLNYSKMRTELRKLKTLMEKTNMVRLVSKNTDISFSIKNMPAIICAGEKNIPDGEIYTAPVKNSVNGYITYNTPSIEEGFTFTDIHFEVKNGKIIKATSNNNKRINEILNTDESARYFGEFAIGVNPHISVPLNDTLFDEKIHGSIHLTPGASYEDAFNGNKSSIHWDLVLIQRSEYGGGEIYFDDKLIRKNGIFVHPSLKSLNPQFLK